MTLRGPISLQSHANCCNLGGWWNLTWEIETEADPSSEPTSSDLDSIPPALQLKTLQHTETLYLSVAASVSWLTKVEVQRYGTGP